MIRKLKYSKAYQTALAQQDSLSNSSGELVAQELKYMDKIYIQPIISSLEYFVHIVIKGEKAGDRFIVESLYANEIITTSYKERKIQGQFTLKTESNESRPKGHTLTA